jgi:hypothetical protein
MQETKMTVRVDRSTLENAKQYAAAHKTTLTGLIQAYLDRLPAQPPFENAPIVARLSGLLSNDVSPEDYKKHLEEKYGR